MTQPIDGAQLVTISSILAIFVCPLLVQLLDRRQFELLDETFVIKNRKIQKVFRWSDLKRFAIEIVERPDGNYKSETVCWCLTDVNGVRFELRPFGDKDLLFEQIVKRLPPGAEIEKVLMRGASRRVQSIETVERDGKLHPMIMRILLKFMPYSLLVLWIFSSIFVFCRWI